VFLDFLPPFSGEQISQVATPFCHDCKSLGRTWAEPVGRQHDMATNGDRFRARVLIAAKVSSFSDSFVKPESLSGHRKCAQELAASCSTALLGPQRMAACCALATATTGEQGLESSLKGHRLIWGTNPLLGWIGESRTAADLRSKCAGNSRLVNASEAHLFHILRMHAISGARELLSPIDTEIGSSWHRIGDAGVNHVGIHDVPAMPWAVEPFLDNGLRSGIAGGDVLGPTAPGVTGLCDAMARRQAIRPGVTEEVVHPHVDRVTQRRSLQLAAPLKGRRGGVGGVATLARGTTGVVYEL